MSHRIKNIITDAEELLHHLLTNEGMTNTQALKRIKHELGEMARDHAQRQLITWWREDNGI